MKCSKTRMLVDISLGFVVKTSVVQSDGLGGIFLQPDPLRVYLALTPQTPGNWGFIISTATAVGVMEYIVPFGSQMEFYLEKHKILVQQGFKSVGGTPATPVVVTEVLYKGR